MKKKIFAILSVIFTSFAIFATSINTSAVEYNEMTGYLLSPAFKLNQWSYGPAYKLTSAYMPLTGGRTGVFYNNLGYLESGYAATTRYLNVVLGIREGTKETMVKHYTVTIKNRKVTDIVVESVDVAGKISSTQSGNLFIAGYLPKVNGIEGDYQGKGTNLFYYNIVVE